MVHEVAQRLAPDRLPVFSSDGLALYFYALTAHFGQWSQALGERRRVWTVATQLLYAQVVKRYRRRRVAEIRQHVYLGTPETYRQALWALGFSGRIQTAFVARLRLRRDPPQIHRRIGEALVECHALAQRAGLAV